MLKNRFRNYGLWISIAALIPLALSAFGIKLHNEDKYIQLINTILSILVALGILNNPNTDNRWYGDDNIKDNPKAKIKE